MLFYAPRANDMSKTLTEFGEAVDVLSNVFAGIYFVEFVIKITGLGPRQYFRYKWNLFDFFLVVVQARARARARARVRERVRVRVHIRTR